MKGDGIPLTPACGPLSLRRDFLDELLACVERRRYHGRARFKISGEAALRLGYQFSVRLSLAAAASLVQSVGAGAVTFPTQFVPSMTVYVSDLDNSRVRSVRLARGQMNFTVEVPSGRYLVFM